MTGRADPTIPVIAGHEPARTRAQRKNNGLCHARTQYAMGRDGRPHARGYTFQRSDARKIVPKRRFDLRTPHGLLKRHAYNMDVTRAQMAAELKVSVPAFDAIIGYKGHRLKPWMVRALAPLLALTDEDLIAIRDAGARTLGWPPA